MNTKITSGLLGLCALLMVSQSNAATVSVVPAVSNVDINDALTLTVQGTDIADTIGGDFIVSWDPAQLQLTSTAGDISTSAALNGFPFDFLTDLSVPGSLVGSYGTFGTVTGPTVNFLSLDFIAIGAGPTSVDIFADLFDGLGVRIDPLTHVPASVTIGAVPVPAAVWLFGCGLIGLVGVARRKNV